MVWIDCVQKNSIVVSMSPSIEQQTKRSRKLDTFEIWNAAILGEILVKRLIEFSFSSCEKFHYFLDRFIWK